MQTRNVTQLTPTQTKEIVNLANSTQNPAIVWHRLAEMGDTYAAAAQNVITEPGGMGWAVVRGIWHASGAKFEQFDNVAKAHLKNYIGIIQSTNGRLPFTNEIETSYVSALTSNHQPAKTAIDVCIEKIKYQSDSTIPHWYETPGVMHIENARIKPSDIETLKRVSKEEAHDMWLSAGTKAYAIGLDIQTAKTGYDLQSLQVDVRKLNKDEQHEHDRMQKAHQGALFWFNIEKGKESDVFKPHLSHAKPSGDIINQYNPNTGISIFHHSGTGDWAYYDNGKHGKAHMHGREFVLTPENWSKWHDEVKILPENSPIKRPPGDVHQKDHLSENVDAHLRQANLQQYQLSTAHQENLHKNLVDFARANNADKLDYLLILNSPKTHEATVHVQVNEFFDYREKLDIATQRPLQDEKLEKLNPSTERVHAQHQPARMGLS